MLMGEANKLAVLTKVAGGRRTAARRRSLLLNPTSKPHESTPRAHTSPPPASASLPLSVSQSLSLSLPVRSVFIRGKIISAYSLALHHKALPSKSGHLSTPSFVLIRVIRGLSLKHTWQSVSIRGKIKQPAHPLRTCGRLLVSQSLCLQKRRRLGEVILVTVLLSVLYPELVF
jgi:hypothetical protein